MAQIEDIPPSLILDIMSRLGNSADVARCRVASKIFNSLSRDLRCINLHCSFDRYIRSRRPSSRSSITPFKTIFRSLISKLEIVESVAVGVEKPPYSMSFDELEDENDDLYLTDVNFIEEWLPRVCDGLKLLSVSNFWVQDFRRRSDVLSLISSHCHNLVELESKNAWLSVDGLKPMPKLLNLTLENIRLDDENLNMLNQCFPNLQVLNLIGVEGLEEPRVNLMHLHSCQWTVSNTVCSVTIIAPNLAKLKLKCVRPKALIIQSPSLSDLHLSLWEAGTFKVQEFDGLTNLYLESLDLQKLLHAFPFGKTIKNLKLGLGSTKPHRRIGVPKLRFYSLFIVFPNVSSLTLTHWAWSALEMYAWTEGFEVMSQIKGLKEITAYIQVHDFETTLMLIFSIVEICTSLVDMRVFIHRDVVFHVTNTLITRCMTRCPRVRWRWGIWKEGVQDTWIPDGI